jgi:NAD+ kinase
MLRALPSIRRVAVATNPQIPETQNEGEKIVRFLHDLGVSAVSGLIYDPGLRSEVEEHSVDVLIALGGDGTMLRAGHLCAPAGVPILGINWGKLGFLTEIKREEWPLMLPKLIEGKYWLESRMMLRAELWDPQKLLHTWDVLNEVVVGRGEIVRPVRLEAEVDERLLTTFVADALVVATPTGSTAYALAAGGPILPPELRNILMVAVAPHLSLDRALVLSEGSSVRILVHTDHQAVVCADGQDPVEIQNSEQVLVRASDFAAEFIRFQDPGYFYRNLTPHMSRNPFATNNR